MINDVMTTDVTDSVDTQGLTFLWLELTSRCNLRCVHCYAESEPHPRSPDVLSQRDYERIIDSAARLGCRQIQFIGGEPTLVPSLPYLVEHASQSGFTFIEVFTNALAIPERLLTCFKKFSVHLAVSVYSDKSDVHDAITKHVGSHAATIRNIKRFLAAGLDLRIGITAMAYNSDRLDDTIAFLRSLGIENIKVDRIRSFGRGTDLVNIGPQSDTAELCGSCWRGSVCVAPNGDVVPCIMGKRLTVGSVLKSDLADIVHSEQLRLVRRRVYEEVWLPVSKSSPVSSTTSSCEPNCSPSCQPVCNPRCSPQCNPTTCNPNNKCNPDLYCNP